MRDMQEAREVLTDLSLFVGIIGSFCVVAGGVALMLAHHTAFSLTSLASLLVGISLVLSS